MKLATLPNHTRDGALCVVSRDLTRCVSAAPIAATLQSALERWQQVEPALRDLAARLDARGDEGEPFNPSGALAPLPRAWQWLDGSAYESHSDLMHKVFKMSPVASERPLMYQGISDTFLNSTQDVPLPSEEDGIDFEGEFGVIVDEVPLGVTPEQALGHIRLVVQINDWSLRTFAPIEMKTGFGWIHAKPPCSVAPVAVTPDELGEHWRNSRVALPLDVWWNGERFGRVDGYPMAFGFDQLVAHAARTRRLVAGTIIGSGTVSNKNYREVGSSCIAERRGIEMLDKGEAVTGYMRFGDRVRMEATLPDGAAVFGPIDQKVVKAG